MTAPDDLSVLVTREPPPDWNQFVESDPHSSFCHLSGWSRVFDDALGLEPVFLSARTDGAIAGVMPAYRMPNLLSGTALISVPYLNYGGPLGTEEIRRALVDEGVAEARRGRDRLLEIRTRHPVVGDMPVGRAKITVTLPLPDDPTTLFEDGFRSKLRSQIRRPMKEGMETRFGLDESEAFYHVFSRNMRDLGTPVLPARFFQRIVESFPDLAHFGVVYHDGEPVAAGCGFRWKEEFEMTWASSLREYNRLSPNMLLYWSFMERCIADGVSRFNFGRCTPDGGTHRFKTQWGGEDEALPWIQWPDGAGTEDGSSGFFEKATSVWSRLPLPIANRLGPVIARRLPAF